MRGWIILFVIGIFVHAAKAEITGTILDQKTKAPLIGATVQIHELDLGTITDADGQFIFSDLKPATYHIHVSYVGYQAYAEYVNTLKSNHLIIFLEPTSLELNEIIIESNHFKTGPREQSLSIEILDEEFLKANRKESLARTLEDIPGLNTINTGVGIGKPVIRGMSFNRVIVNDKGIKQEGQQWGSDHGLEIDAFEPGRIEIVKGPSSLLYGSDGLGGVINIFPAALPQLGERNGSAQGMYKSNNQAIATSTMAEGNHRNAVFRARFTTQNFGDYQVPATSFNYNSFELPIYDGILKNTAGKERHISTMVGIKKDWGYSTITVSNYYQQAGLFVGAIGIPRSYQLSPDGNTRNIDLPRQITSHFKIIANNNILLGKNWLEFDIGFQQNNRREESLPHNHGKGVTITGNLAHGLTLQTYSANARYYLNKTDQHARIIGIQAQYQLNERKGFEFLLPNYQSGSTGAFIFERFSWANRFTLSGGLRIDYAANKISEYLEPIFNEEAIIEREYMRNGNINNQYFNASGAVGLSFYPNQTINLKFNLGSSFKVPTAAELAMNGVHHGTFRHELGDSTLTSERGYQADLSISIQRPNFSFVLTPFLSYFDGFIYLAPTTLFSSSLDQDAFPEGGQVYQYRQHDAWFGGGELAVEYHPIKQLHLRSAIEYVINYNLETYLPLPFTPPPSVLGELNYDIPFSKNWLSDMQVGLQYKFVFDQNRVDRNEQTTPSYQLVSVHYNQVIQFFDLQAEMRLSVQNLLNTQYYNHLSRYRQLNLPEQGRNIVLSLSIPFAI